LARFASFRSFFNCFLCCLALFSLFVITFLRGLVSSSLGFSVSSFFLASLSAARLADLAFSTSIIAASSSSLRHSSDLFAQSAGTSIS
jgi:hypothetical protein